MQNNLKSFLINIMEIYSSYFLRRLESYNKIQKELAYLSGRQEYLAQKEQLCKQYRTTLRKHNTLLARS